MELQELPLVLFTIFTQMSIGLVLISGVREWAIAGGPGQSKALVEWITVLVLLAVGVGASFFHLGHPLGAVRMLSNLGTAWLSREILMVGIFGGLVVVTLAGLMKNTASKWLITITAIAGALAVLAMSMTYAPPSMPAIDNYLPLVFFGLTTLILGAAIASYFIPAEQQHWLTIVLSISLTTALVVNLMVPTIWISGDKVMQMTGQLHLASPLYWIHLGVGLALPLAVLAWARHIPVWLPPLLFIGEFSGRIIFFSLVLSSAVNLGGLY